MSSHAVGHKRLVNYAVPSFDAEVTLDSGSSYVYNSICSSGDTLHAVFGTGTVKYIQSTNEGTTWSGLTTIGSATAFLDQPIAADGNLVVIACVLESSTVNDGYVSRSVGELYVAISTNGGSSFSALTKLTTGAKVDRLAVCVSGTNIFIVAQDHQDVVGGFNIGSIYFIASTNSGGTWGTYTRIVPGTNKDLAAFRPTCIANGNNLYVAWMDSRDGGTLGGFPASEVYFKKSANAGGTFTTDARLTVSTPGKSDRPVIRFMRSGLVIVCDWNQGGTNQVHAAWLRSLDLGDTWGPRQQLSANSGTHGYITSNADYVYAFWRDANVSNFFTNMRMSRDDALTFDAESVVSATTTDVPSCCTTTHYVHGLWSNQAFNSWKYRRRSLV